jgi:uncharacterized protein YoxC
MLTAILIINILVLIIMFSSFGQIKRSLSVIMVALDEMKGDIDDIKEQTDKLGTYNYK